MQALIEALRKRDAILFVGAGISMNVGLPSWGSLVGKIADRLGYDNEIFGQFGDYLALAEFFMLRERNLGALRSWMDTEWHTTSSENEWTSPRFIECLFSFHSTGFTLRTTIAISNGLVKRIK